MKNVTIKIPIRSAAAVRQVLFEAQRGYGTDFVPERIEEIRQVIVDIDKSLESALDV